MTSFWELAKQKYLIHCQYRAIHLARCNPDYYINHTQEHKEQLEQSDKGCTTHHCPEADKRIKKEVVVYIKGKLTSALAMQLELNGLTTAYQLTRTDNDGGTELLVYETTQSDWPRQTWQYPVIHEFKFAFGLSAGTGNTTDALTELIIQTSTSTWIAGTQITVYGILK